MRWLALLTVLGCHQDSCDPEQTCGSSGKYRFCHGAGTTCEYQTNDGSTFACRSCGDCGDALQVLNAWCETTPLRPMTMPPTETCQQSLCPQGVAAYKFCSTTGAARCRYLAADGASFVCNSCSDCTGAVNSIAQWCSAESNAGSSTTGTTGGSSATGGTTGAPPDCTSCATDAQSGACASDVNACVADSGCVSYNNCLNTCAPGDTTCENSCASIAPAQSQTLLSRIGTCICSACATACAGTGC